MLAFILNLDIRNALLGLKMAFKRKFHAEKGRNLAYDIALEVLAGHYANAERGDSSPHLPRPLRERAGVRGYRMIGYRSGATVPQPSPVLPVVESEDSPQDTSPEQSESGQSQS